MTSLYRNNYSTLFSTYNYMHGIKSKYRSKSVELLVTAFALRLRGILINSSSLDIYFVHFLSQHYFCNLQ